VEIAEYGVFRTTWEQAAAAGLPARLSGVAAALAPKAGPALTRDPLGLVFSATAAGLGVLYLAVAVCGAPRRARVAVTVLAAAFMVGVPAFVLAKVSDRTGVVRAQDPAIVQAQADASRLIAERSPYPPPPETSPRGREALSTSFRLDPPAEVLPTRPLMPPGPSVVAGLLRGIGVSDLRLATTASVAVLAAVLAASLHGRRRRTAVALALLVAPLAIGTVLGSPHALPLAALVAAWAARRLGRGLVAGLLIGAAVALAHESLLVAPFLLLGAEGTRPRTRAVLAALATYVVVVVPVAVLDPAAFAARLGSRTPPGPGLGVFNLLAYRGAEASAGALALAALAPLLLVALLVVLLRRPGPALVGGGAASLGGIVLAPALSPEAIAVPIVLLAMAATEADPSQSRFAPVDQEIRTL
jgi:hypothetical protein